MISKITMKDVMTANCRISNAEMLTSNHCAALARELNAILAAPVVQRQPKEVLQVAARMNSTKEAWFDVSKEAFDEYMSRGDSWIARTLYTAPPELSELQAKLDMANNIVSGQRTSLDNCALQIERLQAEIERLKGGQGEPFGWWRIPEGCPLQGMFLPWVGPESERDIQNAKDFGFAVIRLYTSQPAPVSPINENAAFEDWRKEQIASLVRMGYPDAAKAFRDLGSVQWAGWQARARLEKQREPVSVMLPEPVGKVVEFGEGLKEVSWIKGKMPELGSMLYASAPTLFLPARRTADDFQSKNAKYESADALADAWNACLDKVKELNQ